jgi:hypothetical protein
MVHRFAVAALLTLWTAAALAQQPLPPTPLYPGAAPRSIEPEPLPPLPSSPSAPPLASSPAPSVPPPPLPPAPVTLPATLPPPGPAASARVPSGPATQRVFCDQPVTIRLADRAAIPDPYRQFIGIWSDAAWNPQLCAALVVESVQPDGTASILYVFGPMGSNTRRPGGVLHGTGVIRDAELRFQNSDGTQFSFRPLYADLDGRLTTPQGQSYQTVFKKTL